LIVADKPPKPSVAANLTLPGVVDRHVARPYCFQFLGASGLEGVEVLPDGISKAYGACLVTCKFNGTHEIWKPWHFPSTIPSLRSAMSFTAPNPTFVCRDPVSTQ